VHRECGRRLTQPGSASALAVNLEVTTHESSAIGLPDPSHRITVTADSEQTRRLTPAGRRRAGPSLEALPVDCATVIRDSGCQLTKSARRSSDSEIR
jgi:hypothetical protein